MTEATDVIFSMPMVSLASAGRMARMACGSTMRRSVSIGPMPSEEAATACCGLTERMPPRMISAAKAAWLSEKPMTAVVKLPNFRPISGSASKTKTSCSSSGVPRTTQI